MCGLVIRAYASTAGPETYSAPPCHWRSWQKLSTDNLCEPSKKQVGTHWRLVSLGRFVFLRLIVMPLNDIVHADTQHYDLEWDEDISRVSNVRRLRASQMETAPQGAVGFLTLSYKFGFRATFIHRERIRSGCRSLRLGYPR